MIFKYEDNKSIAKLWLKINEPEFGRSFFGRDGKDKLLTIAWNRGKAQQVIIDGIACLFPENTILPLMVNQSFQFHEPENITAWQFNREFYCIVNHDREVSCVGFLFYGSSQTMFIHLDEDQTKKIHLLLEVFKDEFESVDAIQAEMLRILLARLIITITRLAKLQFIDPQAGDDTRFNLYRQFNLMVENNYRRKHDVQFYADELNKSPKTLANVFALYGQKTPTQVIQERVILEARRLFSYTDKSAKEIAEDLGFEDASHFSRFFKNQTGQTPTQFKKLTQQAG